MATYSSILARIIPWVEEPGRLHSPWGRKELDTTELLMCTHMCVHAHTHRDTDNDLGMFGRRFVGVRGQDEDFHLIMLSLKCGPSK